MKEKERFEKDKQLMELYCPLYLCLAYEVTTSPTNLQRTTRVTTV